MRYWCLVDIESGDILAYSLSYNILQDYAKSKNIKGYTIISNLDLKWEDE